MTNKPNYFLADLPPEASLSASMVHEACLTLKRNRQQYLAERSTDSLIQILGDVGRSWRQSDYRFRRMALDASPEKTGFSKSTLIRGMDDFFAQFTEDNVRALLEQELGHDKRLDHLVATTTEDNQDRTALARGPELLLHITAGLIPNPAWMSLLLGLLTRSAQFVKCASGAAYLPLMLAHSLYEIAPKLGACIEVAEWRGGNTALENVLFDEADCVTASGADETLAAIRCRLSVKTRFVGYGHRVSFGYISGKILAKDGPARIAAAAARDVAAWNQLGCLSPHVFYVEHAGHHAVEEFAEHLAEALALLEKTEPRGPIPVEASAAIATRRAFYEIRAAHSSDTRCWFSPDSTAWSVVYEADPRFQMSCLHRFVYVKGVAHLEEALHAADAIRNHVSTVGVLSLEAERKTLALKLAHWGAPRICPIGRMQNPPLAWRHDGRPALAELITWTDLEN